MISDPHIALIRTAPDAGFYDRVTLRIAARNDFPRGVLLHFSTVNEERLLVGTAFRDPASMVESFVGYTALEAQNEMVESGVSYDLARDEYALQRLFIERDVASQPFGLNLAGGVAAFSREMVGLDLATYRALTQATDTFDEPANGRIAQLAFSQDERQHVIDFWRTRSEGESWYEEHEDAARGAQPEVAESGWLELHSFFTSAPQDDPIRNFHRTASGPASPASD